MANLLELFFDTISKQLSFGLNGPLGAALPTLGQEEGLPIKLTVIKQISRTTAPLFERVNMTGYALQISVSATDDLATVLASQNTWTVDGATGSFTGTLPLNTSGINALTDGEQVWLEIRLFDGTYYYRKRFKTRVEKAVATAGSPQPIPGDTALGSLEASRTYVKKEGTAGEGFILTSADGTKQGIVYWGDDNAFHAEPIT